MAEGEVRIKELEEITTLTQNHYFIVDDSSSGGETKKYQADKVTAPLDNALLNEASSYDTTHTYNEGDYCLKDNVLYRCLYDNVTGTWTASKWVQTSLGADLTENTNDTQQAFVEGTASGTIATFHDGSNLPLKSLTADITAIQEGSGDPSPTNIRPISGWDEANVTRTGKNLFDKSNISALNAYIATDKVIANSNHKSVYIPCKPNTTYTVQKICVASGDNDRFAVGYTTEVPTNNISCYGIVDSTSASRVQGQKINLTITTGNDAEYLICWLCFATGYDDSIETFQIEVGSQATAYEPYNGHTYSLTFTDGTNPLTVYYGTVDLISGLLTINKCGDDMGNMNYTYQSLSGGRNGFSVSISDMKETTGVSEIIDAISSCYKATNYNGTWANGNMSYFYPTGKTVIFINNDYTDASTFKTAMTGQQFVYPLSTPLTYQLSKQQIKSLVGENNIFADTGDILDATYIRNANITINDLIRRIENLENA